MAKCCTARMCASTSTANRTSCTLNPWAGRRWRNSRLEWGEAGAERSGFFLFRWRISQQTQSIETISNSKKNSCRLITPKARLDAMKLTWLPRLLCIASILCSLSASTLHAQDWAKARLEASPRHREYVSLKHGDRTVQAFVVYPEVKAKAPVIILIHEIFGLSDWAKEMADELAAQGFIVVAPDLLTGFGPSGGASDSFPSMDATTTAVSGLDAAVVTADLDAAADYAKKIPAGNGKIATVGFCWGGGKSFAFATHRHD